MILSMLHIVYVVASFIYYLPADPKNDIENFKIDYTDLLFDKNLPMSHFWCSGDPFVFKDSNIELLTNFTNKILKLTRDTIKIHGFIGFYIKNTYLCNSIPSLRILSMLNYHSDSLKSMMHSNFNPNPNHFQSKIPRNNESSINSWIVNPPILESIGNLYIVLSKKMFSSSYVKNKIKVECKKSFIILNETIVSLKKYLPINHNDFFPTINIETRLFEMLGNEDTISGELKLALGSIENLLKSIVDVENGLTGDSKLNINPNPDRTYKMNQARTKKLTREDIEEKLKNEIANFKNIKERIIEKGTNMPIQRYLCVSNLLNIIESMLNIICAFYVRDCDCEDVFKYNYISNVNKLIIQLTNYETTSTLNTLKILIDYYIHELHPFLKLPESYEIAILLGRFYSRLKREFKTAAIRSTHLKQNISELNSYFQSISNIFENNVRPIIHKFENQNKKVESAPQTSDLERKTQIPSNLHPFNRILESLRIGIEENSTTTNMKEMIMSTISYLSKMAHGSEMH